MLTPRDKMQKSTTHVRMHRQLHSQLVLYAEERGMSFAELLNDICKKYFNEPTKKIKQKNRR